MAMTTKIVMILESCQNLTKQTPGIRGIRWQTLDLNVELRLWQLSSTVSKNSLFVQVAMSLLTVIWSMCSAASLMLAMIHLIIWLQDGRKALYLLIAIASFSASAIALIDLFLLGSESVEQYLQLTVWSNFSIFLLLVSLVWFIDQYFGPSKRWLAVLITFLWAIGILVNFTLPGSLTFIEITELRSFYTSWGEAYIMGSGEINPWKYIVDIASLLFLLYIFDASRQLWKTGRHDRASVVGGSLIFFIAVGGIHTPLVDAGIIQTPYMVPFAFLAIVIAMSYELVTDVVEAGHLAREIKINEKRWRSLMESIQLAVVELDTKGFICYANPFFEQFIGLDAASLKNRRIVSLLTSQDARKMEQRLREIPETGINAHSEWHMINADGKKVEMTWAAVKRFDKKGNYTGIIGVGNDITQEIRTQRSLESSQREIERLTRANLLGELVSTLAHELNQPLTAILSNAQAARRFLATDTLEPGELVEILDDIVEDDKRASDVLQGLRAMLQKGNLKRELLGIDKVIEKSIRIIQSELDTKNTRVETDFEALPTQVHVSEVEMQQVFINLLLNATQSMQGLPDEKRKILVSVSRNNEFAVIKLTDNGQGIDPINLARVFDPFFSLKPDGFGMGLAISKRIIEAHHGKIDVENRQDGGALFTIRLPLVVARESA
jgi:PAS domain S-box-containing protein